MTRVEKRSDSSGSIRIALAALVLVACGGTAREAEHPKAARYDAELSVLLHETAEVVRRWYPKVDVDPSGTIRTPWQQIPEDRRQPAGWGYETQTNTDRNASRIKYFVRFDVTISEPRPAHIVVTGHGAKFVEGTPGPVEFLRADEPRWVSELAEALRLKIHKRLERLAR